jgi:transcriptional regulator with XRE-family HTH domain
MAEHKLSAKDVARILGRSPQTVFIWRNGEHRAIPSDLLQLLQLKITQGKAIA